MDTLQRKPLEDLLWDAAIEGEAGYGPPVPSEEILEAYRAGGMTSDEAGRLEERLADSRSARQRLAALAGVAAPRPAPEVREKVLTEFARLAMTGDATVSSAASRHK